MVARPSRSITLVVVLVVVAVAAATGLAFALSDYVGARERRTEQLIVVDQIGLAARLDELATSSLHLVPELADPDDEIDEIVEDIDDETGLVLDALDQITVPVEVEVAIVEVVASLDAVVETGETDVGVEVATGWSSTLRRQAVEIISGVAGWVDPTLVEARTTAAAQLDRVAGVRLGAAEATELRAGSEQLAGIIAGVAAAHDPGLFDPSVDLEWADDAGAGFDDFDQLTELVVTMTTAMRADVLGENVTASLLWVVLTGVVTGVVAVVIVALLLAGRIRHGRMAAALSDAVGRDELTGLPGRVHLESALGRERRGRTGTLIGVLYLDLDGFKSVNDTEGHHVGDRVLRGVADRLRAHCRESDVPARIGGDEFVVMLPGVAGVEQVLDVGERLVAAMASPFHIEGREVAIGVSIGAAMSGTEADLAMMLRDADEALYEAKAAGRGRVVLAGSAS